MESTGIVRKVDELGRVVLPMELRRTLGITDRDAIEIYVDFEKICLKRYEPACVFCNNTKDIRIFHGKKVCRACATAMGEAVGLTTVDTKVV